MGGNNVRSVEMIEELRFKNFKRTLELYIQRLEKAREKTGYYDSDISEWLHHLTDIHELITNRMEEKS